MLNKQRSYYNKWLDNKAQAAELWLELTGEKRSKATARKYFDALKDLISSNNRKVTGVFGDTHIPFDHPNYLQFVLDTFSSFGVTDVICTGDLVDNHAISRHLTSPDSMGAIGEYDKTLERVALYTKEFKELKMVSGNHDSIPVRQAATLGIPREYIRNLHEVWNLPDTWIVREQFIKDSVVYKHGIGCGGKDGAYNTALIERMSTVIGHAHAYAGCKYAANSRDIIYGLNVGAGIDVDAYAFEYGKHSKYKPILGCGIVFDSNYAMFIPMPEKYFRS